MKIYTQGFFGFTKIEEVEEKDVDQKIKEFQGFGKALSVEVYDGPENNEYRVFRSVKNLLNLEWETKHNDM